MTNTKNKLNNILNEIEDTSNNTLSTQQVMNKLLDRDLIETQPQILNTSDNDIYKFDMNELNIWKENNNNFYNIRYYNQMVCKKPIIGKLIIFINKIFRKIFKFIGEPIVEQQNRFNGSVTASINALSNNEIVTQNFIDNTSNKLLDLNKNIENLTNQILELNNKLKMSEDQILDLNNKLKISDNQILTLENNIKNIIEAKNQDTLLINSQLDYISFKIHQLNNHNKIIKLETNTDNNKSYVKVNNPNIYNSIDYFDFENHFRGIRDNIKNRQKDYVKYFIDKKNVLDLGCGRGEFLELLKENNVNATGIDAYTDFVDYCNFKNLKAINDDIIKYLISLDNNSIDGIMCSQVVEHLTTDQMLSLCNLAYEKLQNDSYIIIETPNPSSLAIYTNGFYIDPSHIKPVHSKTLEYILSKVGFKDIQTIYTEQSKINYRLPLLESQNINNLSEVNDGINLLNDIIFGSQDYAIIARR